MSRHLAHRLKHAAAWAAVCGVGIGVGWLSYHSAEADRRGELAERAKLAAVALAELDLPRLPGLRTDVATPGYEALKDQLRRLRAAEPHLRFVYVFRHLPATGKVIYLADSAERGAKDESLPGDEYQQAPSSSGLQAIIRNGRPATEGPLADDFGTWVTAYAALGSWDTTAADSPPRHVIGLDVSAEDWRRELWTVAVERVVVVWLILGIPMGAWLVLRRQREQNEVIRNLSGAMEEAHSAIMIIDRGGRIEYGNSGLSRNLGYARRELIGRSWRDFLASDDGGVVAAEIGGCLLAGVDWEGEWSSRRKDGSTFPVRGGFAPVKHRDGTIACFVAVFDDVTDAKRREAELREATELAQAGDRAKGQFLATMSHEVRTPLNGVVGFTSLLLETQLTAEQREYVQTIRLSAEALIQLTGDILDFARIESGKVKLDPAPCNPRECVEESLDLLAGKAAEKNIVLLHRIDPGVPGSVVIDGGRLRQVLVNLIGNAVKFTPGGEVEVTVAWGAAAPPGRASGETTPPKGGQLLFTVRDTGIGIPVEHQSRLFRPFSQGDDSTTRRYGGTGLGLAICRNLVGLMGGEIGVTSAAGVGSTFTFSIRAAEASPPPAARDLQGARILLVAPPGPLRREIAGLVRDWQGAVAEADDAATLPAGPWAVVVMDVSIEWAQVLAERSAPAAGWDPARTIGLVAISTPNVLRTALRRHFRLLVNKPLHHDSFSALLAGPPSDLPPSVSPGRRFGYRVLVVEDNAVNQRLIKRVLENFGCLPTLVENGREALDLLAAGKSEFDLVLLDMHMPVLDGLATLSAIRAGEVGPRAQALWIIALSADAREQQQTAAKAAGLNDYLTKPLNFAELGASLQRFADERAQGSA